jgi:hydrogenase-4 component E
VIDFLLVILALTGFVFLGSSRLQFSISTLATQGIILGLIPFWGSTHGLWLRAAALAALSITIKGVLLPLFLRRAMQKSDVWREDNPFVGYAASMMIGIICLGISFWLASRLPLPANSQSLLAVTVSLFFVFVGLFILISRRKALTQVLGYLVMENGVFVFGVALAVDVPVLVELGTLLDVFVAVFVMGIMIFHIRRSFDHIDTDQLTTLVG